MLRLALLLGLTLTSAPAFADPPEILKATAHKTGMGWKVSVTVSHPDTGWEHFADAWRIETADGDVLDTRELLHPHVSEQPFTRSLSSVLFPDGTREVFLRAHCSEHGWSETTFPMKIGHF